MKMLFIKTAAHLDARVTAFNTVISLHVSLNILAYFPSPLAEDAMNGSFKRKRECLKLEF